MTASRRLSSWHQVGAFVVVSFTVGCEAPLDVGALCAADELRCVVDGVERCVDPRSDPRSCGACGVRCPGACVDGACCAAGARACEVDGDVTCVDVARDVTHCGDCGVGCGDGERCLDGSCCATVCEVDGASRCVNLDTDERHCGACESSCDGECRGGVCCGEGRAWCDGVCVDVRADAANCGGCGEVCVEGVCQDGACCASTGGLVCVTESVAACVDPLRDPTHCGACDSPCASGLCEGGVCCAQACGDTCLPGRYRRVEAWGGDEAIGVRLVDLDRDGYDDGIWNVQLDEQVEIHWGNAAGTLERATVVPFGRVGVGLDVGDVDGDGHLDLVASVQASGPPTATEIRVFFGDGARGFTRSVFSAQSGNPGRVVLLDTNDDDVLDLVFRQMSAGCTALRSGRGDGTFGPSECILPYATLADEDVLHTLVREGRTHLLDLRSGEPALWEHRFDAGRVVASERVELPAAYLTSPHFRFGLDVLDADRDGEPEMVLFERTPEAHVVHLLDGEWCPLGDALEPEPGTTPRTRTEYLMAAGDFDGDGGIDFAGRSTCGSCASVKTVHLR
ncbi:MAG: FG-GAP-like repeat-containing protein [Polyangiales bacterium]